MKLPQTATAIIRTEGEKNLLRSWKLFAPVNVGGGGSGCGISRRMS